MEISGDDQTVYGQEACQPIAAQLQQVCLTTSAAAD
jgi:hypothetical protein